MAKIDLERIKSEEIEENNRKDVGENILFSGLEYIDEEESIGKLKIGSNIEIKDEEKSDIFSFNYDLNGKDGIEEVDTGGFNDMSVAYKDKEKISVEEAKFIKLKKENTGRSYSLKELRLLATISEEFNLVISAIKNNVSDRDILTQDEKDNLLLEDLKKMELKFSKIKTATKDELYKRKKEFENLMEIIPKYEVYFYEYLSNVVIEDLFDYGELYEIMSKEVNENDFVTNIDIRDGWVTYTTSKNRKRKVWNQRALTQKEVEVLTTKLLRKKVAISESTPTVNTIIHKLGFRISVKLWSKTSSSTNVVSIRRLKRNLKVKNFLSSGFMTPEMYEIIGFMVRTYGNIMISGATGTGKTTNLNAFKSEFINEDESVIMIEDTPEVFVSGKSQVAFYSEDKDGMRDSDNLIDALRHQPDRIIIGEIRKSVTAAQYIQAVNTGHKGTMVTIHSNNCNDAIRRTADLVKEYTGGTDIVVMNKIRNSIDYIIQLDIVEAEIEDEEGKKKRGSKFIISEIALVKREDPFYKIQKELTEEEEKLRKYTAELEKIASESNEKGVTINNSRISLIKTIIHGIDTKISALNLRFNNSPPEIKYIYKYNEIDETKEYVDRIKKRGMLH